MKWQLTNAMLTGTIISAIPPLEAGQACDNQKNTINT